MNLTAGRGGSAWKPRRMYFEAHDAPPFGVPDETFDATAIEVSLSFGPLGTLRSGNLGLSSLPAAWEVRAWPRMIRARLESEHGTGFIGSAIAEAAIRQRGELSGVPLTGLETAFLGRPGTGGPALDGAGLTPGGTRVFGVTMPTPGNGQTRQQAVETELEPYPNSEAGVTADLAGVIGRPEAATPALYTVDHRATGFRSLGWSVTDYLTDVTYRGSDAHPARVWSRGDVPPFAPRRTASVSPDPATETLLEQVPVQIAGTLGVSYPVEGNVSVRTWIVTLPDYRDEVAGVLGPNGGYGLLRTLRLRLNYTATLRTKDPLNLVLRLIQADGQQIMTAPLPLSLGGVISQDFELTEDRWNADARTYLRDIRKIWVDISGDFPADTPPEGRNAFALNGAQLLTTREYDRPGAVVMPLGWNSPFAVGPTYEFSLPGVHVPPFRITIPEAWCGVPGGVTQYAAGAVVTWNRGEASTKILTGALPYAGQKRGSG